MIKKILFLLTLFCAAVVAQQSNNPQQTINKADKSFFIENKGQWNPEVKYLARIGGMNAWITNSGVVYDYYKINRSVDNAKTLKMNFTEKRDYENKNTTIQGHVVKLQLVNSENNITGVGNSQHEGYYNYFIGNDQSKWASNVPLYDNVEIQGVYKSIDVKYYYDNGMLRYDYKAKPGADISQIKFKFEGQDGISINANGELVLKTSIGEVTNGKIYAYQVENGAQKEVQCKFEQKTDGTIGLNAESYDAKKELIIDPLVYSTFIGGEFTDYSYSIALDSIGNTYITGQTFSVRYPVTIGAYETSGSNDNNTGNAFVTKIDTSGKNLIYSTYLGGTNVNAQSNSIAVDHYGNAYITGTSGSGYPTTAGVYLNNGNGVFITKLNSSGNSLAYSTYIGSGYGNAIAIDNNSNTYITGLSYSGYPTTPGAFQTKFGGGPEGMADVIVTKLNPQGTSLLYSTYIGSGYNEEGKSIAVDKDGEAYITGFASSTYYPTTTGAYKTSGGGSFITKLDANGSKLVYSTFIGNGYATAIAIDTNNNAYITGRTDDSNFPTTQGVYQSNLNGVYNTFITKLNNLGSSLIYSTYLGGSNMDLCTSIALDKSNNVYITGYTESKNYPITKDAFKTSLDMIEMNNGFISMLNTNGTFLIYSSLIDGQGQGLVADKSGDILITGYAGTTYLNILDKYNTTMSGLYADAFVTKITVPQVYIPAKVLNINPINYSNGISQPVKIKWFTSSGADSYKLQISSDSTFTSVIIDTTGITDTSISITGLSNLTTYYWRVNATNVEGTSPWSNIWSFRTLGNPTRPAIIYPAANSTNIPLNINFTWGKAKDEITSDNITKSSKQSSKLLGFSETNKTTTVSNYWMQLATDTTGTNYFVNDSTLTDTTKLISGLNYYTNYYWRVRSMNESGWGAYTGWSMFTTIIDTPAIVQQISPAYGSIDSVMPVQLTWSSSARAATYRLQFSKDSTFTTAIIDTAGQTDTTFTFYELKNLITYYWRINATNAGGTSAWSNVWKFQIYVDPSLAVLAYPASNSINIPVDLNFRWSNAQDQLMLSKVGSGKANRKSITKAGLPGNKKIAGLSRYWFQLMADTTSKSYISNDSTLTDTVKFVSGLTNLTQYWWRVRVFYDTAWGACTNWSKFITVIDTPDIVQLSVPIDSSNGNILPIKFNWFSSARAATYRLQISSDSTFTTSEIDSLGLKDTSFYVNKLNSLTKYYWRVNASNAGGACSWSSIWNFKTLGNPTQAILVYPGNNSVNIPVTVNFSWNKSQEQLAIAKLKVNMKNAKTITNAGASGKKKISNVSRYWFELMTDTTITNFVVNDSTLTDTTKTVSGLRNLTNYWWRVKGMNETGWGTYTNWSKFTTIVDTPGIATLISPNGSSRILETAISVLFTWEKAPYASTYEYQIASDKNFGTVYWDTTNVSDTVSMYYGMVTSTFYWRVRGSNIAGTGPWSEVMTVSTVTGTDRISKDIPIAYELYQNYPNPFNPSSKIRYALPFNSNVKIEIYNVLGQKVKEILNEEKAAGYYEVNFNTTGLASGVYLYMIYVKSTDGKSEFRNVKKMVLLK